MRYKSLSVYDYSNNKLFTGGRNNNRRKTSKSAGKSNKEEK